MRSRAFFTLAMTALVHGHTIFQKVSVNGVDQGQLKGVRAPSSDYPIENVNDSEFACNKNIQFRDSTVINIPAGARVGAWWGHVIGGPQGANDPDHPIAKSHKGPTMVYLAKVNDAATADGKGLKWFKISEDGLDNSGQWGVDRMIANAGWQYFTMPTCVAPGQYLMRVELLALHSAYSAGGAQFYMECAQINVTGGGSSTGTDLVSFPGAYTSSHPGITINIYGTGGVPNNAGKPYTIPGPSVLKCDSVAPTPNPPVVTTALPSAPATTVSPRPTSTIPPPGLGAPLYGQCGGTGFAGPTFCQSGVCKYINEWYSQCT